jgi:tetratricopeptide (TPR) repeat protein
MGLQPTPLSAPSLPRWGRREGLIASFLVAAVLVVYLPVLQCQFVNYDDDTYVTRNPKLNAGLTQDGLRWGLSTFYFANWHPLVWWSYLADAQFYGPPAAATGDDLARIARGFHLTNLLWHIGSVVLLFAALRRTTGELWPSAAVAALFALHPVNVQAVAWVSERKGVISTFFWMLTLLAYARYAERPGWLRYGLVFLSLALGLMAKQMLVTLPCVLLLLDYWPLARTRQGTRQGWLLLEKIPLFLLVAGVSTLTILAQRGGGTIADFERISLAARISNALVAYVAYLGQAFWPAQLAALYPHPRDGLALWQVVGAAALLATITGLVIWQVRRAPFGLVGWLWFLGTLVPVLGLVQVGNQARADRYAYVPLVGIFIAGVWSVSALARRWQRQRAAGLLAGGVLAMLAISTWEHVHYWQSSVALWTHDIEAVGGTSTAHHNLGQALKKADRAAAIQHFHDAIRLNPENALAYLNLGVCLTEKGEWAEAVTYFEKAVSLEPHNPSAHANLGIALSLVGRQAEAAQHLQTALHLHDASEVRSDLDVAMICSTLGVVYVLQDQLDQAGTMLRHALALAPDLPKPRRELAYVLHLQGFEREALAEYQQSLRQEPGWPQDQARQAWALATHPDPQRRQASLALRLARQANQATRGQDPQILDALGAAYAAAGQFRDALASAQAAVTQARAAGQVELAQEIEARVKLYVAKADAAQRTINK